MRGENEETEVARSAANPAETPSARVVTVATERSFAMVPEWMVEHASIRGFTVGFLSGVATAVWVRIVIDLVGWP